jgi:hypothetical protein
VEDVKSFKPNFTEYKLDKYTQSYVCTDLSYIRIHRFRTATYKQKRTLISSSGGLTWVYARARECVLCDTHLSGP